MSTPPPFFMRYGISRTPNPALPLVIEPYPEVCYRGALRPTVVAAAVDLVGSFFAREVAGTDALLTTDLSVRAPARPAPGRMTTQGRSLRVGRSVITSEAVLQVAGAPAAYGQTSFRRVPRPASAPAPPGPSTLAVPEEFSCVPLDRPLVAIIDTGTAEWDEFPLLVSPIHVPWFDDSFVDEQCADAQPFQCTHLTSYT